MAFFTGLTLFNEIFNKFRTINTNFDIVPFMAYIYELNLTCLTENTVKYNTNFSYLQHVKKQCVVMM